MSNAPSQTGHDPTLNSHQRGPPEPGNLSSTVDLPPDPLLDFGSFIDANPSVTAAAATTATSASTATTTNYQTLYKREPIRDQQSAAPATSNGAAESITTPQKTPLRRSAATELATAPEKTQQRRSAAASSTESLSWLPPAWIVEDRVRSSGATAGTVDKYYFDPVSGRRFRSKKEVLYFLEFGTARKRKKENSDTDKESMGNSGSSKQKKSGMKGKTAALNFDYFNAPEKIEWVLTDDSKNSWTPFIGKDKLPESVRQDWVMAFASATSNGHQARF